MDEQRIGMMYWNLFKQRLRAASDRLFGRGLRRSGLVPWLVIAVLVVVPSIAWELHRLGQFSKVKREMRGEEQSHTPILPRPGGVDPILLTRAQTPGNNLPQFLSATILPGLGMGVLQVTAFLPNRGEVPLLVAPTLEAMAEGTTGPRVGLNDMRGAIEVPWAGGLAGVISPLGTAITTNWKGRTIEVPTDAQGRRGLAEGGLLALETMDTSQMIPSPDGASATGILRANDFAGHWPSKTDVTVGVQMGAREIDLTVSAKNVGDQPEPMGIGWHPRFSIPSGKRDNAELRLPNGERLVMSERQGHAEEVHADLSRFTGHPGELGTDSLDETLVQLKPGLMDKGPNAELRDRASGFGLRVTAVSASIRALRVMAPAGASYVSIGTQTNYDDPLGKQWDAVAGAGIVTLQPGQTMEWKIRLEIFPVMERATAAE